MSRRRSEVPLHNLEDRADLVGERRTLGGTTDSERCERKSHRHIERRGDRGNGRLAGTPRGMHDINHACFGHHTVPQVSNGETTAWFVCAAAVNTGMKTQLWDTVQLA